MKHPVQFEKRFGIGGRSHVLDKPLEQFDPLLGHVRDGLGKGKRFQSFADHVDLEAFRQIHPRHPGATARLQDDQPITLQPVECDTNGNAAYRKTGREFFLTDAIAGGERSR